MHDNLIGPFFFSEKTVTGRSYLGMLELYTLPQFPPQTILQQDGAPHHFCHLDREMAGRWIGRGGPIAWPPTSPDLTPLDFFLWRYMKNIVYRVKINDLRHLKARSSSCEFKDYFRPHTLDACTQNLTLGTLWLR
jgi:hypothetical protein